MLAAADATPVGAARTFAVGGHVRRPLVGWLAVRHVLPVDVAGVVLNQHAGAALIVAAVFVGVRAAGEVLALDGVAGGARRNLDVVARHTDARAPLLGAAVVGGPGDTHAAVLIHVVGGDAEVGPGRRAVGALQRLPQHGVELAVGGLGRRPTLGACGEHNAVPVVVEKVEVAGEVAARAALGLEHDLGLEALGGRRNEVVSNVHVGRRRDANDVAKAVRPLLIERARWRDGVLVVDVLKLVAKDDDAGREAAGGGCVGRSADADVAAVAVDVDDACCGTAIAAKAVVRQVMKLKRRARVEPGGEGWRGNERAEAGTMMRD